MRAAKKAPMFVSQRGRARLLSRLVLVFILVAGVQAVLALVCLAAVRGTIAIGPGFVQAAELSDVAFGVAFVAVAVVFVRFSIQGNRNVAAIGRPVKEYSAGSMGWWYFVPILNLIRPYQAMRAVWDASRPRSAMAATGTRSSAPEVSSWWTAWIIAEVLARIASRMEKDEDQLAAALIVDVFSIGAMAVAGFLLQRMALELAQLQDYAWTDEQE